MVGADGEGAAVGGAGSQGAAFVGGTMRRDLWSSHSSRDLLLQEEPLAPGVSSVGTALVPVPSKIEHPSIPWIRLMVLFCGSVPWVHAQVCYQYF